MVGWSVVLWGNFQDKEIKFSDFLGEEIANSHTFWFRGLWGVAIFIILFLSIFRFPCYHLVLPMGEKPGGGGVGGLGCRYLKKHPLQLVEHLNDLDNNFINFIFLKSVIWHDCQNFKNI